METFNSSNDSSTESDSYRTILPAYTSNNQYLLRSGFNQLKQDMGFTQIRFYCFKNATGRAFHIMTNEDTNGTNVVNFFTTSDNIPVACGSFTRLPDDNSSLAVNCDKWGQPTKNRWGHASKLTNDRLFVRPLTWSSTRFYRLKGGSDISVTTKRFPYQLVTFGRSLCDNFYRTSTILRIIQIGHMTLSEISIIGHSIREHWVH